MDSRRLLTLAAAGLCLSGCALFQNSNVDGASLPPTISAAEIVAVGPAPNVDAVPLITEPPRADDPEIAAPPEPAAPPSQLPFSSAPAPDRVVTGRTAIAAANRAANAPSRSDAFVGGVQVFAWSPGRVYEIWTAPLRVTTLTLGAGETIVSKAAGDTVRWQIGDTTSGAGTGQRTHVLLKPLERGLETNLVLTTNKRVYLIALRSGPADEFNAAVTWDEPPGAAVAVLPQADPGPEVRTDVVMQQGPLDGRYRIQPAGRRPRWTPTSVFNDGRRTFITFDADLQIDEAPALFLIAADGEAQLVNYRQQGGLFVVDRVFDLAELRLGGRRPQIVRIQRLLGERR